MVKLSELRSADEIHAEAMQDLEYRREYERTKLANDVAIKVIGFRAGKRLSQSALAGMLGWRQPHVARLEAGDHEPSLATLALLAEVTNMDFSVEVKRGRMRLRYPARAAAEERGTRRQYATAACEPERERTVISEPSARRRRAKGDAGADRQRA
jgi:transcriptional regulator with XRE-family HTH domain